MSDDQGGQQGGGEQQGGAGGGAAGSEVDPLTGLPKAAPAAGSDGGQQGGGQQGGGDGAVPEWAAALPNDAPDDKTLSDQAWAKNKGYATVADAVKAHRELERAFGAADKLALPKDANDKAAWDRVYDKLGRPASADKYDLPVPDGGDKAFAGEFGKTAFELGLSGAQATKLTEWWNGQQAAAGKATADAHATEVTGLKSDLGGEFDKTIELALRAGNAFGFDNDELARMRQAIGPKALITKLAAMGRKMGEDGMTGGGKQDMGMTPEKAEARRQEINRDPALRQKLAAGDPALKAEWAEIARIQALEEERKAAA